MANVGYARVSSKDQSLEIELEKLKHCDKVYSEKESARAAKRTQLEACLEYLREGDTLFITRIDRLARSINDLCTILKELERKKVDIEVIDQPINTRDATGKLFFYMVGLMAEFDYNIRRERQLEGIKKAKAKGTPGMVKMLSPQEVRELRGKKAQGLPLSSIARYFRIGKTSVYRYLDNNYFPLEDVA